MVAVSGNDDGFARTILPIVDLDEAAWWVAGDELCSKMTGTTVMWQSSATDRLTEAIGMAVAIGSTRPKAVLRKPEILAAKQTSDLLQISCAE
jgi:hypothetical protein